MSQGAYDRRLLDALDPGWSGWLEVVAETGSTNDLAMRRARDGAVAGWTVVAERQTAGRGRTGGWLCPPGGGLAMSVVLRPRMPLALWPRLALAAGLAVVLELERLGIEARVKWPNDVLAGGRKLCGVLIETRHGAAVVGIGLNVNVERFPPDLAGTAGSVMTETGRPVDRERLLVGIRASLLQLAEDAAADFGSVLEGLDERCALRGEWVHARAPGGPIQGRACGFGSGGELLIERNGRIERLRHAEQVRVADRPEA